MTTIQPISSFSNKNILISSDGGNLSSDSGLILLKDFLHKIDWKEMMTDALYFVDQRQDPTHSYHEILEQHLYQIIAGYHADSQANILRKDPILQTVLEKKKLSSQSTFSRFLKVVTDRNIEEMDELSRRLTDLFYLQNKPKEVVIDLDSTHSDTFGKQEKANYNAHYATNGYHPLVAFDGLTGMLLGAQLRPGNVYTSNGAEIFLEPIISHLQALLPETNLLVRGDSGFAKPEIYDLCEEKGIHFLIRLKSNARLSKLAESLMPYDDETDLTKKEILWNEISYKATSWKKDRKVIIKSTRNEGELFFQHEFLVTNITALSAEGIYPLYQKRGEMENFIKEIKSGFAFDKTDSKTFLINQFRMMISCVAYSIVQVMKRLVFPEKNRGKRIASIRFQLFHIAGKVTHHARQIRIRLSSSYVFQELFWKISSNIRQLKLVG